ncbi:RNA polymerase I-specific transcription initiation factor RRN3 [Choiromyces venosus 120613-1]|uniref:RNA polymerase I-specific transcription initiation factor RRN3 n=1 Tax=Choiromyces venosus 120613-1 TaxID=1336337 RepID=A0A3N4J834_9PEZI|nr:RNA polymerase I-specific transcription initiation factor RRN3 [Choiromyces venosus 120613-1]
MLESSVVSRQAHLNGSEAKSAIGVKRELPTSESDSENKGHSSKRVKMNAGMGVKTIEINATNSLFRRFVNNALDERAAGNNANFELLRRKFSVGPDSEDAPSSLELQNTISALTNTVSRLNGSCSQLVKDIINSQWAARESGFVGAYVKLLGNLVSAHSNYMDLIVNMLVQHLVWLPSSAGKLPNHTPVKRSVIYERVHYALQFILDLVPTAAFSTLFPALISEFPHKTESKKAHVTYVTNLLRVIEYAPSLRNKLLTFITDRVIKIDTEIQADLDDLEDEQGEELEAEITAAEIEVAEGGTMIGVEEEVEEEEMEEMGEDDDSSEEYGIDAVTNIKDTVDKLDAMLDILFSYYSKSFPNKSVETPTQESIESFALIMKLFNGIILPTYRSRYTQFLVFWAAQKAPRFSDTFCVTAITKALDNTLQPGARQAAAAYVASFIARAKLMPGQYVQIATKIMCRWLGAFVDQRSTECEGPDVSKWGGFYSVCQAVMYIFCFRWKDLREVEEDEFGVIEERWMGFLQDLNKAIASKFNPLKVCSPAVVETFAKIASHFQLVYCFTIIEQNKRKGLSSQGELDSYFPFDPYSLKRSKRWIQGCYNEWEPIEGLEDEEEEDNDSSEESDNDNESVIEEEVDDDESEAHE